MFDTFLAPHVLFTFKNQVICIQQMDKCMYKAPQTQGVKASTFHYNWYTHSKAKTVEQTL
jgi:phosphopantothenoylcysteine synthetase/decarboxylase